MLFKNFMFAIPGMILRTALIGVLLTGFCHAQTAFVSGNINYNAIWDADTVKVTGNVIVGSNARLDIRQGTYVEFQGFYGITVLGSVRAIGDADDSITFTVRDTTAYHIVNTSAGGWAGMYFYQGQPVGDSSVFRYCKFLYCKNNAVHAFASAKISISNCRFHSVFSGISFSGGSCSHEVLNNVFTCIRGIAVSFSDQCSPEISRNMISNCGGGIWGMNAGAAITHNTIINCQSYHAVTLDVCSYVELLKNEITNNSHGGVVISRALGGLISGNIIRNNGQGLYYEGHNAWITQNIVTGNVSQGGGSGVFVSGKNIRVQYNFIGNNKALGIGCGYNHGGAGLMCLNISGAVTNNVICNNESESIGAGMCMLDSVHVVVANNTIVYNRSNQADGGGVYINSFLGTTFANNIIWGNEALTGNQIRCFGNTNSIVFKHCNMEDTIEASPFQAAQYQNSYSAMPEFVNPAAGAGTYYSGLQADWSLMPGSPCINTGTPDTAGLLLPPLDYAGNFRIYGSTIDAGAFENVHFSSGMASPSLQENVRLHVYPNPTKSGVYARINGNSQTELRMVVTDLSGKNVRSFHVNPGGQEFYVDLSEFPAGIYVFSLYEGSRILKTEKLVRE